MIRPIYNTTYCVAQFFIIHELTEQPRGQLLHWINQKQNKQIRDKRKL